MPMVAKRISKAKRIKQVGLEVEELIRKHGEDTKLQYVKNEDLFLVDTKPQLETKKTTKKDQFLWSSKFRPEKASKYEASLVKKEMEKNVPVVQLKDTGIKSLWGEQGTATKDQLKRPQDEYVRSAVEKKRHIPKRVSSTRYKIKAVEIAENGQSYNPEFTAHQGVLAKALCREISIKMKEKERSQPLDKGLDEIAMFLNDKDEDGESENDNTEGQTFKIAGKSRRELKGKLTRTERNKIASRKKLGRELEEARKNKKLLKSINCTTEIVKSLVKEEREGLASRNALQKLKEEKLFQEPPVKIGSKVVNLERPIPVNLTEELSANLRTMKPVGNQLLERFDNMHKRNLVEIGGHRHDKARKRKMIEKKER